MVQMRATRSPRIPSRVASAYPKQPPRRVPLCVGLLVVLTALLALSLTLLFTRRRGNRDARDGAVDASPRDSGRMHIAVCFTGHVGTLPSVYRQNLQVLQSLTSEPLSLFYVLDLADDYRDARTGRRFTRTHQIGDLQTIFANVSAHAVETISLTDVSDLAASSKRRGKCIREHALLSDDDNGSRDVAHAYGAFHAAQRCFQMVTQHEKRHRQQHGRFDWIVRMRPDMHIAMRLPPDGAEPRVHMSGLALALMPRMLADDFFAVVDVFDGDACEQLQAVPDQVCEAYSYAAGNTECLMVKWLRTRGIVPSNGVFVNRRIVFPKDHQQQ